MFERFTDRARKTIVLAQEEARRLQHNYIGTEHLLLGLLAEADGFAGRAVSRFGLDLAAGREDVLTIIGLGKKQPTGHIPFTPRAKKCLELSLRESLALGHDYIGTEHILLGIVREGDGVAARILEKHAASLAAVRAAVLELLPVEPTGQGRRWLRRLAGERVTSVTTESAPQAELRTTPAADLSLSEAARLAGGSPVGSHHILLAALADPDSAAARTLTEVGVDLDRVREALRYADVTGSSDELPEEAGRRHTLVRVAADRISVEVSDPAMLALGRAALEALAARAAERGQGAGNGGAEGIVRGDDQLGASLSLVWLALRNSLEDIRGRAGTASEGPPAPPGESAATGA
jgi:ATP-dependent Clp protease ATP-binding subunit ClpA